MHRSQRQWLCGVGVVICATVALLPGVSYSESEVYILRIEHHRFEPETLRIPSGTRFKLVVHNLDNEPEEFESHHLKREKIIPPRGKISLQLGPLKPGEYPFFGEFHEETAQGKIVCY